MKTFRVGLVCGRCYGYLRFETEEEIQAAFKKAEGQAITITDAEGNTIYGIDPLYGWDLMGPKKTRP